MILNIYDIYLKCHFTLPKIGLPKIITLTPPMVVVRVRVCTQAPRSTCRFAALNGTAAKCGV